MSDQPKNLLDMLADEFSDVGQPTVQVPLEAAAPAEEIVIEIPGVDGRTEVFKGATHAEVVEKIAESKRHANEHIQRLQQERIQPTYQDEPQHQYYEPQPLDADTIFALTQGQYTPENTQRLWESVTGISVQEFQDRMRRYDEYVVGTDMINHTESFLEDNLDYNPTPANLQHMENYIVARGLPWTKQSLEDAYAYLSYNGLLEQYPQEQTAPPVTTSTGLSDRMSDNTQPVSPAVDYSNMSTAEMRQRLIDDFNKNRGQ